MSCQKMYPMRLDAKAPPLVDRKTRTKMKRKTYLDLRIRVHVGPLEFKTMVCSQPVNVLV